jgi:cobalt-zinc-cadmium efflux system membrane fusion protein
MKYQKAMIITVVLLAGILAIVIFRHDSHPAEGDGHAHDETEVHNEHEDENESEHEEEQVIELTEEQIKEIGIELAAATEGQIDVFLNLPGEVAVNADHMAHIVPRVPGVVVEVKKKLGDTAKAGEVMAVISSRDLADAKAGYLAAIERYDLAKTIFEREEKLWKEKISSEQDYLDARKGFAEANIQLRNVRQKLHALGFSQASLEKLPLEKEDQLTHFEITAPFDGVVIDKHITLGEVIGDDAEVFVIADLSSVWVDLHVYPKDLMNIKKGQRVIISVGQTIPDAEGVISYVGPVVGTDSRTAIARVVLPNSTGNFRPGLFVTARVTTDSIEASVVVSKNAVQTLEGKKCVFIKDEHGFEPAFVVIGIENTSHVEILSGLAFGQEYVTKGAFDLKSNIVTSTLDSHAGHGH